MTGTVKRVNRDKGFGFLRGEDDVERFFHMSGLRSGLDIQTLQEGTKVDFEHEDGPKGPRATDIVRA